MALQPCCGTRDKDRGRLVGIPQFSASPESARQKDLQMRADVQQQGLELQVLKSVVEDLASQFVKLHDKSQKIEDSTVHLLQRKDSTPVVEELASQFVKIQGEVQQIEVSNVHLLQEHRQNTKTLVDLSGRFEDVEQKVQERGKNVQELPTPRATTFEDQPPPAKHIQDDPYEQIKGYFASAQLVSEMALQINTLQAAMEELKVWRSSLEEVGIEVLQSKTRESPDESANGKPAGQEVEFVNTSQEVIRSPSNPAMVGHAEVVGLPIESELDDEANSAGSAIIVQFSTNRAVSAIIEEQFDKISRGYTVQETSWDSVLLVGFNFIGTPGTLLIIFTILISIMTEVLFSLIVYANSCSNPYDGDVLDGLLHWRAVIAHDIRHADAASQTSLASRVCAEATSTESSVHQMYSFSDLKSFRDPALDEMRDLNGYFLCNMAIVLFFFGIMEDIIMNYHYTRAVFGCRGEVGVMKYIDGEIDIKSFSWKQVLLILNLVTVPRFGIAIFLGYVGMLFLAYTSNVQELLLNATALFFISDIDEMMFRALTPQSIAYSMRLIRPIHNVRAQFSKGVWTFSLRVLSISVAVAISNYAVLIPFDTSLETAFKYICSGRKDILYMENKANNLVMYAESPMHDAENVYKMSYTKRAVLELLELDMDSSPAYSSQRNSSLHMSLPSLWAFHIGDRDYAAGTSQCIDHLDSKQIEMYYAAEKASEYLTATPLFFRDGPFDMPDIKNCSQLNFSEVCTSVDNVAARGLCARHCGCDSPWSGQFFAPGIHGCPKACERRWHLNAVYMAPFSIAQFTDHCMDVPANILSTEPSWISYVQGFESMSGLFASSSEFRQIKKQLLEEGCESLVVLAQSTTDLCLPTDRYRSARSWCPSSCRCSFNMKECPHSCSYATNYQMTDFGKACPVGLEIQTIQECEVAFAKVRHAFVPESTDGSVSFQGDLEGVPAGCAFFFHSGLLLFSTWNGTFFPSDMMKLCKQPVQRPLDNNMGGSFALGRWYASCLLNDGACPEGL